MADQTISAKVTALNERITAFVLDSSPELLSIGLRCRWEGYNFSWAPYSDVPTITTPDEKVVELLTIANVPCLKEPIAEEDASAEYHELVAGLLQDVGKPALQRDSLLATKN